MLSSAVAVTETSDISPLSSKEFLDIQATIECEFTLKRICDMIRTYSHINYCFKKCKSIIRVKQLPVQSDIYNNLNCVTRKHSFIFNYCLRFDVEPSSNRQLQFPMYFWKSGRLIMIKTSIKCKQEKPLVLSLDE